MITKLKLRKKFILGFSPLLLILVVFGVVGGRTFFSIKQLIANLHETVTPQSLVLLEFKRVLASMEEEVDAKMVDRQKTEVDISSLRVLIKTQNISDADSSSLADQGVLAIRRHAIRIIELAHYILNLSGNGWRDTDEMEVVKTAIRKEQVELGAVLDKYLSTHLQNLNHTEQIVVSRYRYGTLMIWTAITCGLLISLYMSFYLTRTVLLPIAILRDGARQIGNGALDYDLTLPTGDEFEELAAEFRSMAMKLKESYAQLDHKILVRTEELSQANVELKKEIAERLAAEEEQKRAETQVHILTQELLRVQEVERKRIALDLHDNIAQELSALKVMTETLSFDPITDPTRFKRQTEEWAEVLKQCVVSVRELSYNLWPSSLEYMGIKTALIGYCRDFTKKTGVQVDFSSAGMDRLSRLLSYDFAINIYRLVQESLNNIRKHAKASRVQVKLVASGASIVLQIADNGQGCDLAEARTRALREKRFGLLGMQERVNLLGGSMTMSSSPDEGTRIFIEIPWDKSHADEETSSAN